MQRIIAGSRTLQNSQHVCEVLNEHRQQITQIITSEARGADRLGYRWAWKHQVTHRLFRAAWERWGKSAGVRWNAQMARAGDVLVACWSLTSRGTAHTIGAMQRLGKPVVVFGLDGREVEVARWQPIVTPEACHDPSQG